MSPVRQPFHLQRVHLKFQQWKGNVSSNFLIIFFWPLENFGLLHSFRILYTDRNFFKATSAQSPFFKKASEAWSFIERLMTNCSDAIWRKRHLPCFFQNNCKESRAWVPFNLHNLPFTVHLWIHFGFSCSYYLLFSPSSSIFRSNL